MDKDALLAQLETEARSLADSLAAAGDLGHAHQARNLEASLVAYRRILKRSEAKAAGG